MFQRSLFFMEKEKLRVLIKELTSPYLVSDFYEGNGSSDATDKKDLEHDFSLLKKEIMIIRKRVEANFNNLDRQMKFMEKNPNKYEIQSLIYLDILRNYISSEIDNIGKINQKISQLLRDGYHQYLPKPILGKRFSSVNITSKVEKSLTLRLKELSLKDNHRTDSLIVWDYTESYQILDKENYISFRLPYWYFEFSYFLPNLTHEIGHRVLENNEIQKELEKKIKSLHRYNKELFKGINNFKYIPKTLSKEISADIIAFNYHGASFFYALTHKFLATGLSSMFKANEDGVYDDNYKIIDTQNINIEDAFDFYSKYKFSEKKDFIFIRLYILLEVERKILKENNDEKIKEKFNIQNKYEIRRLLNSIYTLDAIEYNQIVLSDLSSISDYSTDIEYEKGYKETVLSVTILTKEIINYLLKEKGRYFIQDEKSNKLEEKSIYEEIPKHFNDIWNKRFKELKKSIPKSVHRFEFRKKLHKETIVQLIKEKLLSIENLQPYNMVFLKYNLESIKNVYEEDLSINFSSNTNEIEEGLVFGIYDYIYLRKLNSPYKLDILRPFKYEKYEHKNIKYYESSYSLIKIMDDTIAKPTKYTKKYYLNAIIQIEIPKVGENADNRDIYEDLFGDLKYIKNIFENEEDPLTYKHGYKKIEYFKSLGPKDITIRINSASMDLIFEIKKNLAKKFKRTFTTFYLNNINPENKGYEDISSKNDYIFISNLRMHQNYKDEEFIKLCRYESNIERIVHTTGVMDYQITWQSNISFQTIVDFYSRLTENKMVMDIQTAIDKKINLGARV